jgi:hypothetical protein
MRARTAVTALALCATATATTLLAPLPAMADTATVTCISTGYANSSDTLIDYECDLNAMYATGETWSGIQVNASSQGTATATGTCKTVTLPYAYYPQVKYVYNASGQTTTAASRAFLCGDQF